MLQYLNILLDDTSTSFCHYNVPSVSPNLIPLNILKDGIVFAMKENLMIQFVYPDYEIPSDYMALINSVDHFDIGSGSNNNVVVVNDWDLSGRLDDTITVIRTTAKDLFVNDAKLCEFLLSGSGRINIAITDIDTWTGREFSVYGDFLDGIADTIASHWDAGLRRQLNLLTDRLVLDKMNNCGAGHSNITLAPDGRFYVCPAFYYDAGGNSIGDLTGGLKLRNPQLYKFEYAPICKCCDAYHCRRCIWLNKRTTLEVNTPSHEQCVVSHIERNASRRLLEKLRSEGADTRHFSNICEIDYLDPFDVREKRRT